MFRCIFIGAVANVEHRRHEEVAFVVAGFRTRALDFFAEMTKTGEA